MLINIVYFPVYSNLRAIGLLVRECLVLPSLNQVFLFSSIIIISALLYSLSRFFHLNISRPFADII